MNTMAPAVPFADLLATSRQHRTEHRCAAYPYQSGSLLSVLAAGLAPARIAEVGTAVGYSAICMADAAPAAQYGVADRVTAHCGDADDVLQTLESGGYDLAFFDGFAPTASILTALHRLLRPGGVLVCANLTLGGDGNRVIADAATWLSHSFGETALAVKR